MSRVAIPIAFILALLATEPAADTQVEQGRLVFTREAQPSCSICHTLADAGSSGLIGPNLDELKPSADRVRNAVTGGVAVMPPFAGILSQEQIDAVARYVAKVTGGENP